MPPSLTAAGPAPRPHAGVPDISALLKTRTVSLGGNDAEAKRAEILAYFHNTFSLYESLFNCLNGDAAFYARANRLRHPLIFYYGHTSVFLINKLNVAGLIHTRLNPKIESMLAIGVDEMSWDDLDEKHYDWPTPQEVKAYRDEVRGIVDEFIRTCDITLPIGWNDPLWIVMMGIEHERIHLETSAVLIRELPLDMVHDDAVWGRICPDSGAAPKNELLPVKGGDITLGKSHDNPYYGWDNEYGTHKASVKDFKASKYLVSNDEYLAFVKDGGYKTRAYWSDEGWQWVSFRNAEYPPYWVADGDGFKYRAMLKVIDMPWDWPVDVNCLEAQAFCRWLAQKTGRLLRLPTEEEWYMLRALVPQDQPTWPEAPGNINLEHYMSACPVNRFAFAGGFFDIIGNVWQWTETPIDGYDGFSVHPAYDDFSTPTFDGRHNIFKGGCWASTGNYAIRDARYAFRRHFIQNSGIRYVEAEPLPARTVNVYETDTLVSQYIEFQYGESYFGVPNFAVACAEAALAATAGAPRRRALDLGCAAGRLGFELARKYDSVDAIDFSARLIKVPTDLQQQGNKRYVVQDEGELVSFRDASLADLKLGDAAKRVRFMQGDACNLPEKYTGYDLVIATNLIDRLYEPMKFLSMIHTRIVPGGTLVLSSPYTWLAEFTERENWLGGFKAATGENYTTLEALKDALAEHFDFVSAEDVPFVLRETRRKYQHTLSELSVWRRKTGG
ncbi:MAG: 5-histidylcysteine sulfoxide synthase [Micavibrio sp.]|nr:5-histidylcysteine sulfoxide synthase [Micavibrio sp.]